MVQTVVGVPVMGRPLSQPAAFRPPTTVPQQQKKKQYTTGLNPAANAFDPSKGIAKMPVVHTQGSSSLKDTKKRGMNSHAALTVLMPALLVPAPKSATTDHNDAAFRTSTIDLQIGELVIAHGLTRHTEVNKKKGRVRSRAGAFVNVDFGDEKRKMLAKNLRRPTPAEMNAMEFNWEEPQMTMGDDEVEILSAGVLDNFPMQPHQPLPSPRAARELASELRTAGISADDLRRMEGEKNALATKIAQIRERELKLTLSGKWEAVPSNTNVPLSMSPPPSPPASLHGPEIEPEVLFLDAENDCVGDLIGDDAPPPLVEDVPPPLLEDEMEGGHNRADQVVSPSNEGRYERLDTDGSSQGMSEEQSPRSDRLQPLTNPSMRGSTLSPMGSFSNMDGMGDARTLEDFIAKLAPDHVPDTGDWMS